MNDEQPKLAGSAQPDPHGLEREDAERRAYKSEVREAAQEKEMMQAIMHGNRAQRRASMNVRAAREDETVFTKPSIAKRKEKRNRRANSR